MTDLINTTVELVYSNTGTYTGFASATAVVAYGTSSTPVSVIINSPNLNAYAQIIDAGYFALIRDIQSVAGTGTFLYDLGFSSTSAATSKINAATGTTLTNVTTTQSNSNEGYGTLELSAVALAQAYSISFAGAGNTLILDNTAPIATLGVAGFSAAGDQIVFTGTAASGAKLVSYSYLSGVGTLVFTNNGVTTTVTLSGMTAATTIGNFTLGNVAVKEGANTSSFSGDLVLSYVPCFLRGTMIDTPFGERPVEELHEGDLVTVLVGNLRMPRAVRWTGGSAMDVAKHAYRDSAFPIRIRRHAFGENMPHRDLLVTPEHCLLTEAGLVPARMLVNGASICIDRDLERYEYFHVELEDHSILLSEGLATESYLDGENRVHLNRSEAGAPAAGLAAPLAVSRAAVEPIWIALRDRAARLGLRAVAAATAAMTDDPGLRLLLDDGSEIAACRRDSQRHMFHIPRGVRPMRLRSRASVPAEVIGPFVDDRRLLGVAVDRMVLWNGLDETVLAAAHRNGAGWHDENGVARWTDGDAELVLPTANEDRFLDIHVAGTVPYQAA